MTSIGEWTFLCILKNGEEVYRHVVTNAQDGALNNDKILNDEEWTETRYVSLYNEKDDGLMKFLRDNLRKDSEVTLRAINPYSSSAEDWKVTKDVTLSKGFVTHMTKMVVFYDKIEARMLKIRAVKEKKKLELEAKEKLVLEAKEKVEAEDKEYTKLEARLDDLLTYYWEEKYPDNNLDMVWDDIDLKWYSVYFELGKGDILKAETLRFYIKEIIKDIANLSNNKGE